MEEINPLFEFHEFDVFHNKTECKEWHMGNQSMPRSE